MSHAIGFDGKTAGEADILARAGGMTGRTFAELVDYDGLEAESGRQTKGTVGGAAEAFFGMRANNAPEPDFRAAGIELKTVPLRPRGDDISVKERVYITMIDYHSLVKEEWETAAVRRKLSKILFVYYDWLPRARLGDLIVSDVVLWEPDAAMLDAFERDWEAVKRLVRDGRAEDISESDGVALVAATKGSGGPPDRTQPYSAVLASRRAWALRPAFLRSVLERERAGRRLGFEVSTTLADRAEQVLAGLAGLTVAEVESRLRRDPTRAKHRAKLVIDAALDAGGSPRSRELLEGGLDVRAVVVNTTLMPYEHLSFPAFRYQELIREDWDGSELLARLDRFLFVPIVGGKGLDVLGRAVCQPPVRWAPSDAALASMAREWTMFRDEIDAGHALHLTPASQTEYIHVRPKGRDGLDTDPAPFVGPVVKKCFWFDREFVATILRGSQD